MKVIFALSIILLSGAVHAQFGAYRQVSFFELWNLINF
jgi:hypothetical protein